VAVAEELELELAHLCEFVYFWVSFHLHRPAYV
jgi:hypothetical protein